ncbi:hypothetical protein NEMBOFW57_010274 [Staphylotrichum longicolle]|uniref:Phosphoinositide phospholipase C n=1 Tax=Staphylotrichum longicolle TaxID=669026 RepID=A0AAD4HWP8_9PEZI|nr:hypothetical protein NEMBOFW57_010274 [Staphylotrichum longicolle]
MARLNPFKAKSRRDDDDDDEDQGLEIDGNTVAGGGHSALPTDITQHHLRVSRALKSFLAHQGVLSEDDAQGLQALLDKPVISPPAHLFDRSHPLPEYFISSSHNTYLMAHQLFGTSSAGAYETTLRAGARCIEIDACAPVRKKGHEEQKAVRLDELGSKIAVIVEYHLPDEVETQAAPRDAYKAKKKAAPPPIIVPELAELGVYAQSVKPRDASWYVEGKIKDGPLEHHLINISESGLASHTAEHAAEIARHNTHHLMRVFPKGTRISSRNLSPIPFWAVGAQICALNWQTFGAGMQLNDALFAGSAGYVLKPASLRSGGSGTPILDAPRKILRLQVAGASDVPLPKGREVKDLKPYLTCTLLQPGGGAELIKAKRKTAAYHQRKVVTLPFLGSVGGKGENPAETDPVWDETLEWEFEDNELVFLRMFIKSDDSFSSNPILAVAAVRLLYVEPGWRFVRMLDLKGHETSCSLLVKFDIQNR